MQLSQTTPRSTSRDTNPPTHHKHRHLPPGPRGHRLALLKQMVEAPHDYYRALHAEFGTYFTLHAMSDPWVVVSDPQVIREVFKGSTDDFHSDADGIKFLIGPEALLFKNGSAHRAERRVMQPPFKKGRVDAYAELMVESARASLGELEPGQRVTARELFTHMTLRTIIECVFGVTDPDRRDRLHRLFSESMEIMCQPVFGAVSMAFGGDLLRGFIDWGTGRSKAHYGAQLPRRRTTLGRLFDAKSEVIDILKLELEQARQPGAEGRDDVLANLVRARYADGTAMTDEQILDELNVLLIGGHDTSANTMTWAMYYLGQHPEVLRRCRDEVDEVFGDGPVERAGIAKLKYLTAVIEETLRMRPVANAVSRRLTRPMDVGDYTLPEGTLVLPCISVMHFREDIWEDPFTFNPDRFVDHRPSPFHFLPFGGGSRVCLGKPFAMTQMRMVLAELVRRLDFHLADDCDPQDELQGILVGASDGVPIIVDAVAPAR